MKKLFVSILLVVFVVSGCTKQKDAGNVSDITEYTGVALQTIDADETIPPETETVSEPKYSKSIDIKGEVVGLDATENAIYTKNDGDAYSYVLSSGEFVEQPMEKTTYTKAGLNDDVELYYSFSDGKLLAFSEDNINDSVYVADDSTIVIIDEGRWDKYVYRINVSSGESVELKFDFGTGRDETIVDIKISPDHTKAVATLESVEVDCIYYLLDFMTGKAVNLNEVYGVPVYQKNEDGILIDSNFDFADKDTIIAAVKSNGETRIIKCDINAQNAEILTTIESEHTNIKAGKGYTVAVFDETEAVLISNDDGGKTHMDVIIGSWTDIVKKDDKWLAMSNKRINTTYMINLETGEVSENSAEENDLYTSFVSDSGELVEYEIDGNKILYGTD